MSSRYSCERPRPAFGNRKSGEMNPTGEAFIEREFCSLGRLSCSACGSDCHGALSRAAVMQLLAGEELPSLLWKGSSWRGKAHLEVLASPGECAGGAQHQQHAPEPAIKQQNNRRRKRISEHATPWAVVSATSLTSGCTGNLFCKAHGSTETQNQESSSAMRKCLLLPASPGLAGTGCVPRGAARAPCQQPQELPPASQAVQHHCPPPQSRRGVPVGCAWLAAPVGAEPQLTGTGCSAARDT